MGFTSLFCGVQHAFDDPSTGHLSEWNGKGWRIRVESSRSRERVWCGILLYTKEGAENGK
jgi:hypothetical protein